jgi:cell division protease FtsH
VLAADYWLALKQSLLDVSSVFLPFVIAGLLALLVYFTYRMAASMPVVRRTLEPETSRIGWDDVAGVDEVRAELLETVEFLRDPSPFSRVGARVPKGVLLHGPPGTGKTLLARAVAGEAGAAFYAQSATEFVEVFAGVGAARIRRLFETARANQPAIVFIDELDAVGAARQVVSFNREQDNTLNQLLVELDGFAEDARVVVMGSTNRLDTLDPALLRPGRFDRQVLVGPPDLAGRQAILRVHTRGKPLAADVDIEAIARVTSGLTGADLESLANEAAIRAVRRRRATLSRADFDEALDRVTAGLERRRVITAKEQRIIAYHEAGHALLSHVLGGSSDVHKVTIVPRGDSLGSTMSLPREDRYLATREELFDQLVVLLGGRAAEQVAFGRISNGAANDLQRVTTIARAMVFDWAMGESVASRTLRADDYALSEETKRRRDDEQGAICDAAYAEAMRLVEGHREALDRLAARLLEVETLDRREVEELLADVQPVPSSADAVGVLLARLAPPPPSD